MPVKVDLTLDALPVSELYETKTQEQTRAYLESVHGPIKVDVSEAGLQKSAEGAKAMPKTGGKAIQGPIDSRDMPDVSDPTIRGVLDKALRTVTGGTGIDAFEQAVQSGTLPHLVGLKMTDPVGNTVEALARKTASDQGLPKDVVEKIGTAAGVLGGMMLPPGKAGAKAGAKVGEAVSEAAKVGINTERVAATPGVKGVMQTVNALAAERLAGARKVVSHAQTIEESKGLAVALDDVLALNVEKYDMRAMQLAVRDYHNAAATHLDDLVKRTLEGDPQAGEQLHAAFTLAGELSIRDELLGKAAARGLESRKILSEAERAAFTPEALAGLAETMKGAPDGDPMALAQRLSALRTKTQKETFARQTVSMLRAGQDALYEVWINALLSGPQTHAANVVSNSLTTFWAVPERLAAATLDLGALGGNRSVYFGESGAMLYGLMEGVKDGIRVAGKAMKEGASSFGPDKMERAPSITSTRFGIDPESGIGGAVDFIGTLMRMPSRFLMSEDAFFKAVNYRMELRAAAYREAASEGLSGKAFADRVTQMIADPPASIKTHAEQFALTNTFNRELSELGRVGQAASGASQIAEALPLGRVVLPFIRTPANILHYASERTPVLNLISDTMRADLAAGGARRAEALGKIGAGGTVSAIVASYAATAINADQPVPYMTVVTGEGPRDPRMKATLQRLGWRPYSIWNPYSNEYVSYRRTDPLGTVLGIVATTTEMLGQLPEQGVDSIATATAIATSKAMLSKTFMEGLSNFLDTMEGNQGDFKRFVEGLASSGVPAGIRQTSRELDPIRRDMDSLYDHWRSGLPGYDGPPELNLWGDPIMLTGGLGVDLVSPIYTSEVKPDAVDEYLARNKIPFAKTPRHVAGRRPPGVRLEEESAAEGVKLTKEERHRLGVLIGKGGDAESLGVDLGVLAGQPPLKEVVRTMMQQPGTDGPEGSRADMIRSAVNDRRRMAIDQLRRESPILDMELTKREQTRIQKKIPGGEMSPSLGR